MDNKILLWIIGALVSGIFSIAVLIGGWWVGKVNASMDVTTQLQYRSLYIYGDLKAAPVATPSKEQVEQVLNAAKK